MQGKIGLILNLQRPGIKNFLKKFIHWARGQRLSFVLFPDVGSLIKVPEISPNVDRFLKDLKLVITVGGDGTLLQTVRLIGRQRIPILGVNFGRLGFLTSLTEKEFFKNFEMIKRGQYQIEKRMMLKVQILRKNRFRETFFVLNDVVIELDAQSKLGRFKAYLDNEFLNDYRANGLIISTPTGSTAFSLAVGGPIVVPDVDALIVAPICAHSLSERPMIFSGHKVLRVTNDREDYRYTVSVDGKSDCKLEFQDSVFVSKAPFETRLIQFKGSSFFELLRTKLNWGI